MNTQIQIQDEIVRLKARLFELSELEKEREAVRSRLVMLLGKAEAYTEMEAKLKAEMIKAGAETDQRAGIPNSAPQ